MNDDMVKTVAEGKRELVRLIAKVGERHGKWKVFTDFLTMSAIAISNSVDKTHYDEREAEYMETVKRYSKDELESFAEMLAVLVITLDMCVQSPRDILGELFHELNLSNKWHGQFFSPQNICNMMGSLQCITELPEKGYVTVCEPCVGAGAMLFGFAKAMKDNGFDYCRHMLATAVDIDIKCVYMSYIQLSLYGIPAVVIHGNSITVEEWSHWLTPSYILGGWFLKEGGVKDAYLQQKGGSSEQGVDGGVPEKSLSLQHDEQLESVDLVCEQYEAVQSRVGEEYGKQAV